MLQELVEEVAHLTPEVADVESPLDVPGRALAVQVERNVIPSSMLPRDDVVLPRLEQLTAGGTDVHRSVVLHFFILT